MSLVGSIAIRAVSTALLLLLAGASLACGQTKPAHSPAADDEMDTHGTERVRVGPGDPALLESFKNELAATPSGSRRPVFEKYLPLVGPGALIQSLEEMYPRCHSQSHELGRAVFASTKDIGIALRECGTGCTSGCMHGAVAEAFGHSTTQAIAASMSTFCASGEMGRLHKPGNCAHGLGHALMLVTGGDAKRSIDACLGFAHEAMQYYCATGVYMERIRKARESWAPWRSVHYPCADETLFPPACYRYKGDDLLRQFGSHARAAAECSRLDEPQRRGCFHGLGYAMLDSVRRTPSKLAAYCATGSRDDKVLCIEGAIEKLVDYDEGRAKAACTSLPGDVRAVCDEAVQRGKYSLDKPTIALYYDRQAVAKRRAELGARSGPADEGPHQHH